MTLSFRYAEEKDSALICEFIRALADYENLLDQVVATEELIKEWVFKKNIAEVIFALVEDQEVGFVMFFHNFSTFMGKGGIYLEDLFVKPAFRGLGYGKALLKKAAQIAVERGCGRMEWVCLDWNQPSIDVYLSLGAMPMDEWTVYRLNEENLKEFAAES